jgi:deoxyadenosine/deoxycytidine kinase
MYERWAAKHNLPSSPPRFQPEHAVTAVVAQSTASEKLPRAIVKRQRPAEERIRQELEKKAPDYIDTPGGKTCWSIAQMLVETRGSAQKFEVDKTSKALKRYYADRLKD